MYKTETQRSLEKALLNVMMRENVSASLAGTDGGDLSEKAGQLAQLLTEQIWAAGYELGPRSMSSTGLRF